MGAEEFPKMAGLQGGVNNGNAGGLTNGAPPIVFVRHECSELRHRRAAHHDADGNQARAHFIVGEKVYECSVELADDRRWLSRRAKHAIPSGDVVTRQRPEMASR